MHYQPIMVFGSPERTPTNHQGPGGPGYEWVRRGGYRGRRVRWGSRVREQARYETGTPGGGHTLLWQECVQCWVALGPCAAEYCEYSWVPLVARTRWGSGGRAAVLGVQWCRSLDEWVGCDRMHSGHDSGVFSARDPALLRGADYQGAWGYSCSKIGNGRDYD